MPYMPCALDGRDFGDLSVWACSYRGEVMEISACCKYSSSEVHEGCIRLSNPALCRHRRERGSAVRPVRPVLQGIHYSLRPEATPDVP